MGKRDEYVERVKKRLDEWNADIKRLEDAYAKAEAGARLRLNEQIESLRRHREQAQAQVERIENAAEEAWHEIARGAEEAWRIIGDVFSGHRSVQSGSPAGDVPSEEDSTAESTTAKAPAKKKAPAGKPAKGSPDEEA
jgi:hypothetical protein